MDIFFVSFWCIVSQSDSTFTLIKLWFLDVRTHRTFILFFNSCVVNPLYDYTIVDLTMHLQVDICFQFLIFQVILQWNLYMYGICIFLHSWLWLLPIFFVWFVVILHWFVRALRYTHTTHTDVHTLPTLFLFFEKSICL